jgi:protein-S-isoprenylcysteine O-methyltransferase Ste14
VSGVTPQWERIVIVAKVAVFLAATAGLAYVSRASLRSPRSHGFYRFFGWEAILALVLLNVDVWFHDPWSWNQVVSWCLLMLSLFLVIHGAYLLRRIGKPDRQREDASLVGIERTTTLVTEGAYRYIRHPLYSSLLCLAWGVFFKAPGWIGGLLAVASTLLLVATARVEEAADVRFFGPAYEAYRQRTKMFIPFLF